MEGSVIAKSRDCSSSSTLDGICGFKWQTLRLWRENTYHDLCLLSSLSLSPPVQDHCPPSPPPYASLYLEPLHALSRRVHWLCAGAVSFSVHAGSG
eukprot:2502781-Rhodomonas_salina.2